MTYAYRNIAVFADATPEGRRVLHQASRLAREVGAELTLVSGLTPSVVEPSEAFARGAGAIRGVLAHHAALDRAEVEEALQVLNAEISALQPCAIQFLASDDANALRFLECDLMIAAHPAPGSLPVEWSPERLLSLNGSPLMLVPSAWEGEAPGRHVVIAWNGSRQARRAVTHALPLLKQAGRVTVLVVDAIEYLDHGGEKPGQDMVDYLAHLGVGSVLHEARSGTDAIAAAIARETARLEGDLVIIGCYSQSRVFEALFGGVTRTMLTDTSTPLFLSF